MKRTYPTNQNLLSLINQLKKKSIDDGMAIWKRVAIDLEKPTRSRRVVNLSRINRYTHENEIIIVPGKVLGSGSLDHKVTISAYQFSEGAVEKIEKAGAKTISLYDLLNDSIKGKKVRIIG